MRQMLFLHHLVLESTSGDGIICQVEAREIIGNLLYPLGIQTPNSYKYIR